MTIRRAAMLGLCAAVFAVIGSAPTSAQNDLLPSSIFRNARASIVLIFASDNTGQPTVQGSGFVIAQDRIVTNHHVVAGASAATAVFSDGGTSAVTAVVADSPSSDVIVLVAKTDQRPGLPLGDDQCMRLVHPEDWS